jgi:hypothetical protein
VIAPIDIECPRCHASAAKYCEDYYAPPGVLIHPPMKRRLDFHHAERVDAALRQSASAMEPQALTHDAIDAASLDDLRAAYRLLLGIYQALREQHDSEKGALVDRIERMRPIFDAAIDWRKHITLLANEPLTQKVLDAIDAAIDAEEAEAGASATKRVLLSDSVVASFPWNVTPSDVIVSVTFCGEQTSESTARLDLQKQRFIDPIPASLNAIDSAAQVVRAIRVALAARSS